VVIAAVAQHQSPLALGNVIGSIISNILAAFSLGVLFQRGYTKFDRSSKIYVSLLLLLTPPIIVLGYFGKGGVIFGSILIVVFGLYLVSIGVAIYRGVLAAPEPEDFSDDDSDSDTNSHSASNRDSSSNSRSPATVSPDVQNESNSDENQSLLVEISSPSPLPRTPRHSPRPITIWLHPITLRNVHSLRAEHLTYSIRHHHSSLRHNTPRKIRSRHRSLKRP